MDVAPQCSGRLYRGNLIAPIMWLFLSFRVMLFSDQKLKVEFEMVTGSKKTPTIGKKPATRRATAKVVKKTPTAPAPEVASPMLRKKELIERVVARSGIKKKDAKPVIEAMLSVLGEALANGEDLNLQPLGKVMVKKTKELANAKMMVTRIRQRNAVDEGKVVKIPT